MNLERIHSNKFSIANHHIISARVPQYKRGNLSRLHSLFCTVVVHIIGTVHNSLAKVGQPELNNTPFHHVASHCAWLNTNWFLSDIGVE